ncbi:FHA domain-containing protein [Eionea flava]
MGIVIEVLNLSGHVVERHVVNKSAVLLGRAYSNDVIIDDPYVDACHLLISLNAIPEEGGQHAIFSVVDQGSLNGVFNDQKKLHPREFTADEGQVVIVGNTRLRLLTINTTVAAARPLIAASVTREKLLSWKLLLAFTVISAIFALLDVSFSNPLLEDKTGEYFSVIYVFVCVFVLAGFIALIGRVLHNDSRIVIYSNLLLVVLIATWVIEWVLLFVFYSLNTPIAYQWISALLYTLVISWGLFVALQWCSKLTAKTRWLISSIAPVLVLVNLSLPLLDTQAVNFYPPYDTTLLHQSFYLGYTSTSAEFLDNTQALYNKPNIDSK